MNDELGFSAGRSPRNPVRPNARARLTPEERAEQVALRHDPEEWPDEVSPSTAQQRRIALASLQVTLLLFVALGAFEMAEASAWWALLLVPAFLLLACIEVVMTMKRP